MNHQDPKKPFQLQQKTDSKKVFFFFAVFISVICKKLILQSKIFVSFVRARTCVCVCENLWLLGNTHMSV